MADTTGYEEAKKRFEKAQAAYEKGRSSASTKEIQTLLADYYKARRDMQERTPMGAVGAGMLRTAGEVVTGIPDLLTEGVNWMVRKYSENQPKTLSDLIKEDAGIKREVYQAPTLGGLFRQATGQAEGPKAPELADYYNAPGYVAAAYSIGSLANMGWKAFKDSRVTKRAEELLGDLNPVDRNMFQKWMVKGQGSSSPEVAAIIEKVRQNPKYSELFTAMENAASKEALKSIRPTGGAQTPEEAATGLARAVQDRLKKVKDQRSMAGNESFEKAFKQAGDTPFVETGTTRATISKLRSQYPDNANVQAYLDQLENKLVPSVTVPATAGRTVSSTRTQPSVDAAGMPIQVQTAVPMNIPGAAGYTTTQEPVKLTVQRFQGFLHEFGKKAEGSDSVVTGLSLNDMERVNSALFSSLKQDLSATVKLAPEVSQKKAAGYLIQAREQYKNASENYDNLIAQGIPKWLQSKSINEVSLEDLTKAYQDTNPAQRQLFRSWVGENRAESLKAIDKAVFDDFLAGSYKKLPDGSLGYDLGSVADTWNTLKKTDPNKAGQLADSLGVDANEFSKRMKDASIFTRKIQVGPTKQEALPISGQTSRTTAAAVGATAAGYPGAKVTELSVEAVNELFKKRGLTEDQLMKVLLTGEGKQFLQNAAISPQSAKTLQSLMSVENAALPGTIPAAAAAIAPAAAPAQEQQQEPTMDMFELPPELQSETTAINPQEQSSTDNTSQWELPPEEIK